MVAILTIVFILIYRLQESRLGRAWMAIREDELAAAISGANSVTTMLLAIVTGAYTMGFSCVYSSS